MTSNDNNAIINGLTFNAETDCKYVKSKINKSGGKSVGILNGTNNTALCVATPLMLTWGLNEFVDEVTGRKQYTMSIQFPKDEYKTPETTKFLENMVGFQDKLKNDAIRNSKEWMNKAKMTSEVVDALFHPMLTYPKDPNTGEPDYARAPTLKVKLDYWDDAFNCEIYDVNQNPVFPSPTSEPSNPMDLITKGSNVALIIRCGGLWFANGKFGCTWKLLQAVVKPKPTLKGKCFITLSDNDIDKMEKSDTNAGISAAVRGNDEEQQNELAEDSEDADQEPALSVVLEDVVPKPKKKIVKRKNPSE